VLLAIVNRILDSTGQAEFSVPELWKPINEEMDGALDCGSSQIKFLGPYVCFVRPEES